MKQGPRYYTKPRRRREGKTDYRKRLRLLKSRKTRIVVRNSLKNICVQFVGYDEVGDKILASAISKELIKKAEKFIEKRIDLVLRYDDAWDYKTIKILRYLPSQRNVWSSHHLYPVMLWERDRVLSELHKKGIMAQVHYQPVYIYPAYSMGIVRKNFPRTEKIFKHELSLPLFSDLTFKEQDYVIAQIKRIVCKKKH